MGRKLYAPFLLVSVFFAALCFSGCNFLDSDSGIPNIISEITAFTLKDSAKTVTVGSVFTLGWQITPQNVKDPGITWYSFEPLVASVTNDGTITALKPGVTLVTGVINNTNIKAFCIVTVMDAVYPVTGVSLSEREKTMILDTSASLAATVSPNNATNQHIVWSSSDLSVAFVNAAGTVLAKGGGKAIITVTTEEGGYTDSCEVTVLVPVTSISINKNVLEMDISGTAQLSAAIAPANAYNTKVIWSTTDSTIATVSNTGLVTAADMGSATVIAHSADGNFTAACAVFVDTPIVPVASISLDSTSAELKKGDTKQLSTTVLPANATNTFVIWNSSNASAVSVDSNGLITAISGGRATITAQTASGAQRATCEVTVSVMPDFIRMRNEAITLAQNATFLFDTSVYPLDTTNTDITWSTSDPAVASVDSTGLVTAHLSGTAVIRAICNADTNVTASCTVIVPQSIIQAGVVLSLSSVSLSPGSVMPLTAFVFPTTAENKNVVWSTNNGLVATVDSTGVITAHGNGIATISATAAVGGYTALCEVTVSTHVTGIILNHSAFEIALGKTHQIVATVNPASASNKEILWASNNSSVASVSENGTVTAHSSGLATITATTKDGGFSESVTIMVIIPVTSITLNVPLLTVSISTSYTLIATIIPSNATNKNIVWTSSNTSVATVSSAGVVTSKNTIGATTITATTEDGKVSASCLVTGRLI